MKDVRIATWTLLAGLTAVILSSGVTSDGQQGQLMYRRAAAQTKPPATAVRLPVYKPPRRGAPGGRVGGSTRGAGDVPTLSVLAPDHAGLTAQAQPSLYWYLSAPTAYPVEVTITDARGIKPLLEIRVPSSLQAGVQRIRLADYGVRLAPDGQYQWFVALIPDPSQRSKDLVAGGIIERIALSEALRGRLKQAGKAETPFIYAAAGVWYDALSALSDLIEAAPQDAVLRQQRAALLEQVGLPEVAAYDVRHTK